MFRTLKDYSSAQSPLVCSITFKLTPCYQWLNPQFIPSSVNAILITLLKYITLVKRNSCEYICTLFSRTASRLLNHWVTMWGSDTNKNEKWLGQIGSSSSNNSNILVSFSLLLEQNIIKYRYIYIWFTPKCKYICTVCIYLYILVYW